MKKFILTVFITIFFICIFYPKLLASDEKKLTDYESIFEEEFDLLYGTATLMDDGYSQTFKFLSETKYKNSYVYKDRYLYALYKYDRPVNATVKILDSKLKYIASNNDMEITGTVSETVSSTYEKELNNTMNIAISESSNYGLSIAKKFKVESSLSATISNSISTTFKTSNTFTCYKSTQEKIHISSRNYDSYWRYEERANYNAYKLYIYEINYSTHKTKHKYAFGKYYTYDYNVIGYELIESMFYYSLINGSEAQGFYEYTYDKSGIPIYVGQKLDYLTYIV